MSFNYSHILVLLGCLSCVACGTRRTPTQITQYDLRAKQDHLTKLKKVSFEFVKSAQEYAAKAKELHEDNEPEECLHYIERAHLALSIAEKRYISQQHRSNIRVESERYQQNQLLMNDLLKRKAQLAQLVSSRTTEQTQAKEAVALLLANTQKSFDEAKKIKADKYAPGPFKKADFALKTANKSMQMGDSVSAQRMAQNAQQDLKIAIAVAMPFYQKEEAKAKGKAKLSKLLSEAAGIDQVEAEMETRGVVLHVRGLFYKGRKKRGRDYILEQIISLINRYGDLRIMVEGHTYSRGSNKKKLRRTEKMAQNILNEIKGRSSYAGLNISALGRGDYAPIMSNSKSRKNERVDLVFFMPR